MNLGVNNGGQVGSHSGLSLNLQSYKPLITQCLNSHCDDTTSCLCTVSIISNVTMGQICHHLVSIWFLMLRWQVDGHLFVGDPPPFCAHEDISQLIMPLNGDRNQEIGQQPFPCKGHHTDLDGPGGEPVAQWRTGQDVTFS